MYRTSGSGRNHRRLQRDEPDPLQSGDRPRTRSRRDSCSACDRTDRHEPERCIAKCAHDGDLDGRQSRDHCPHAELQAQGGDLRLSQVDAPVWHPRVDPEPLYRTNHAWQARPQSACDGCCRSELTVHIVIISPPAGQPECVKRWCSTAQTPGFLMTRGSLNDSRGDGDRPASRGRRGCYYCRRDMRPTDFPEPSLHVATMSPVSPGRVGGSWLVV